METTVNHSQQEEDSRKQTELTGKVGVRLTPQEKSNNSTWSAFKRFLRIG
jgi:hypothetical protein